MRLCLCVFVVLALCISASTASAQESPPFELTHPVTGEAGVWIPLWVQKLHLQTDAALKTCFKEQSTLHLQVQTQTLELRERKAAELELDVAVTALRTQLASESRRANKAQNTSTARLHWALVATGSAIVAAAVITVQSL